MADQDFEEELHYRTVRRTYLLTYSQADLSKFSTRESFADAVIASFENEVTSTKSKAVIQNCVCSKELHPVTGGSHYHMAIKLSSQKRWKSAKSYLLSKYGASVHFSSHHDDYHSRYKYAAKEEKELIHSPLHSNLEAIRSPRTKACTKAYRQRSRSKREADRQGKEEGDLKKKRRRLLNLEVSDFLIKNNIKRDIELFALANERKFEGDNELAEFVLGRSEKESFADAVIASFENEVLSTKSKAVIQNCVCSKELHPVTGGSHYHMAIKLSSQRRWKSAKSYLLSKYGASVHFSSHHDDYHSRYKYAAKEEKELIHSPLHSNLEAIRSPRTKACTKAYRQRSRSKREADRQGKEEGDLKKK
eukprot:gene1976-2245_t